MNEEEKQRRNRQQLYYVPGMRGSRFQEDGSTFGNTLNYMGYLLDKFKDFSGYLLEPNTYKIR